MKKSIQCFALAVLGFILSSQAMAEEKNPVYGGFSYSQMTNAAPGLTTWEASIAANPTFYNASRTESTTRAIPTVFIGVLVPKMKILSVELGYMGADSGSSAETAGTMPGFDWQTGNTIAVPFSASQKKTFSAWHLSFVGSKPMNDYVILFGRAGVIYAHTKSERRETFAWPTSMGGDGSSRVWNDSSKQTAGIFGIGAEAKLLESDSGGIWGRAEILNSAVFEKAMPSLGLYTHF